MDSSTDMSGNEDVIAHRRLTRVLNDEDVKYIDNQVSSDAESNESYEDLTVRRPPTPSPEVANNMIREVKGMTQEQVQELLHKLNITDDEAEEDDMITDGQINKEDEEETNSGHNEQQKKKTQKTKKTTKGNTKGSRQHEDGERNLVTKINKPKVEVKGKKNNVKSTNVDAQLEVNPSKLENKNKVPPSDSNQQDENINKNFKKESPPEAQEKKTTKSKNDKVEIDSNKEKQSKPVKKIGNDNHLKESESKLDTAAETQVEGRVMRARKAKEVLKDINEHVKNLDSGPVKVQNKRNGKKQELGTIQSEGNTNASNTNEDSKAGPKKKGGKKEVPEVKKIEDNPAIEENAVVKVKKVGRNVIPQAKEPQDSVSSNIKEDVKTNRQRKNVKKGISEAEQNIDEGEFVTNVKNTKAKKKPANAKGTNIVNELAIEQVNTEKAKPKSKPDLVKNKKNTENKENKITDETIPNKRAARKK